MSLRLRLYKYLLISITGPKITPGSFQTEDPHAQASGVLGLWEGTTSQGWRTIKDCYISTKWRERLSREGRKECKLDHPLSLCAVEFEP